jgi:hypothetical protein
VPIYDAAWKADPGTTRRPMALAHELPAWMVTGKKDGESFQQVDWIAAIPSLIDYSQKLERRIAALEMLLNAGTATSP